jgi:hypothetical protein
MDADLTTLEGFAAALQDADLTKSIVVTIADGTFCASCGAPRRMRLRSLHWPDRMSATYFELSLSASKPALSWRCACSATRS